MRELIRNCWFIGVMLFTVLAPVTIWGFQCFLYLKHGSWFSFTLSQFLSWTIGATYDQWINTPAQDWVGIFNAVKQFVNGINVGSFACLLGLVVLFFSNYISESQDEKTRTRLQAENG